MFEDGRKSYLVLKDFAEYMHDLHSTAVRLYREWQAQNWNPAEWFSWHPLFNE
jgi:hypothetical protein